MVKRNIVVVVRIEDDARNVGGLPRITGCQQALYSAGLTVTRGLSLRTSTRCSDALRDEANHLTDFWTVTVNLGQDCRWRPPEALQVEEPAGFTTPEGSPRQVRLRRHRHSHANRPKGIEKLEASDREIVSIINTHVSKVAENSG
jgi:hypothetical protein